VTKGSAPTMSVVYNAATNLQTGDSADANGNILGSPIGTQQNLYDVDNRLLLPGNTTRFYGYDAGNKRMWRGDSSVSLDEIDFWAGNEKLGTYQLTLTGTGLYCALTTTNVYFKGKLISKGAYNASGTGDKVTLTPVVKDRQGSIGKFYPYGQERPTATANDTEKFTGYFRDATVGVNSQGLDYADQRYHSVGQGRFLTPDPAQSGRNWYAYAGGDPVNNTDPTGTVCDPESGDYTDCGGQSCVDDGRGECNAGEGGGDSGCDTSDPFSACGAPSAPDPGSGTTPDSFIPQGQIDNQRMNRQNQMNAALQAIGDLIGAAPRGRRGAHGPALGDWPAFLVETSACSTTRPVTGAYQLAVTYQVLNELGRPMTGSALNGISIVEDFPVQTSGLGNLNAQAATWSYANEELTPNGQFTDFLSAGGGLAGFSIVGSALQQFTAYGSFPIGAQPLGIYYGGMSVNGVNSNIYTTTGVTVNRLGATNGKCQ
jgi:RHS repeat-associated protein